MQKADIWSPRNGYGITFEKFIDIKKDSILVANTKPEGGERPVSLHSRGRAFSWSIMIRNKKLTFSFFRVYFKHG